MSDSKTLGGFAKLLTGIAGLDEITQGGLPAGRPTLVCGNAGCGKTLLATTFLVNGAVKFDEPGVFICFEERSEDLMANVASLGYNLEALVAEGKILIDHVNIERNMLEENGEFDLEGLFVRLACAVEAIGAKRVVLDTIEALFMAFTNPAIVRAELRRLFGWIKDHGLTAIITSERGGEGRLTRQGLEEYVSDCVILLDNRVEDQIATRRLRVVKYRGSSHGTDEYPFLIDDQGISVLPGTSFGAIGPVSSEIVSTGVAGLDAMLRKGGYYRGSSILLSGIAGAGKTTISSHFLNAACARGERCLYFVFEESAAELCRNAFSVGLDLQMWVDAGLLRLSAVRQGLYGFEEHLARMYRELIQFSPIIVVVDPISAFRGPNNEVYLILLRLIDLLKSRAITALFTSLQSDGTLISSTDQGLSSLMDTWIRLMDIEADGERNHAIYVIKARGMSHSNQLREYQITDTGVELIAPYVGPDGVLTGAARLTHEASARAATETQRQDAEQRHRDLIRRRAVLESQIVGLRTDLEATEDEASRLLEKHDARDAIVLGNYNAIAAHRGGS
jgi:circadian clock protein KaiC